MKHETLSLSTRVFSLDVFNDPVTEPLLYYDNVRLRYFSITKMMEGSKLWSWFIHSDWHHSANRDPLLWLALSFLLLYKHGGTVMAWDSLTINTLPSPQTPIIASCDQGVLALNVLNYPAKHPVIENILDYAEKTPTLQSLNEQSLQKEILRICKAGNLEDLAYKQCLNFKPLQPPETFCPIESSRYWQIFDEKRSKIVRKQVESGNVKTVNLWLDQSRNIPVWASESFNSAMKYLAQSYCPLVLESRKYRL